LWNASTFRLRRTLRASDPVYAVAFSADSRTVASGSGDTVGLWNAGTGAPLRNLTHQAVSSLALAGSDTVLSGGFDSHVRHWTTDGVLRATWGKHTGVLRSVTFSPDGSLFASSAADTTARLWRASDGADVQVLAEHIDVVNAVAFSPDGQLLATASGSGDRDPARNTIKIWRVGTAASLLTLRGHDFGSTDVAFSVDGSTLISVGLDRALRFWRVSDGALIRVVTVEQPRAPLAMSADRKLVAVGGRTGINIYYADDGTLLRTIPVTLGGVADLVFSPDNGFIAAGLGAYGNNVQIFDVNTGAVTRVLPGDPNGFIDGVAWSPDGRTLAAGSGQSRTIQLWDPATGVLRTTYDQETGWGEFSALPIAFSPSGTHFGYGRGDATVVMARNPA
jgi:WD40 repeat protein